MRLWGPTSAKMTRMGVELPDLVHIYIRILSSGFGPDPQPCTLGHFCSRCAALSQLWDGKQNHWELLIGKDFLFCEVLGLQMKNRTQLEDFFLKLHKTCLQILDRNDFYQLAVLVAGQHLKLWERETPVRMRADQICVYTDWRGQKTKQKTFKSQLHVKLLFS